MRKFIFAVFSMLFVPLFVQAEELRINWDGQPHSYEITDDTNDNKPYSLVGGGSVDQGAIDGASLTLDGKKNNIKININNVTTANEVYSSVERKKNYDIPVENKETYGAYVAGGAAYNNNVTNSSVTMTDIELTGRDVMGGAALMLYSRDRFGAASANNNSVSISGGSINFYQFTPTGASSAEKLGGNVYGGYTKFSKGSASNNTVSITKATIGGDVIGGYTDERLTEEDEETAGVIDTKANGNYVLVKDSTVGGMVAGAKGAATAENNTVIIDNSTVGTVLGAYEGTGIADDGSSTVNMDNNTVSVSNSTITGKAAAVDSTSVNAKGNTLMLDNSKVSDKSSIYAVKMGLNKEVGATVANNTLNLNKMSGTFTELGGSVNLAGTSNGNVVNVTNSALTLSNSGKFFGDTLDLNTLSTNELLPAAMPKDQGAIFGGASMTYTRTVNTTPSEKAPEAEKVAVGGTNSDNNIVSIAGGDSVQDVNANVFGGFSAYIDERKYTIEKKETKDGKEITTTEEYEKKGNQVYKDGKQEGSEIEIDDVYSASNNTVILDNVNFKGTVYGGYVYGAELKDENRLTQNNTVILRNSVKLDKDAVIYGGNNNEYAQTNHLVFDRTSGTFTNDKAFKNFNKWWTINADLKMKLNFGFDVRANMILDKSMMQEGSNPGIVTTITDKAVENFKDLESGKVYDLLGGGIVLTQKKMGVYSYDLTATKEEGSQTISWTLTATKDKANAEVYGQLPLVGLALISEGPEMLTQTLNDLWKSDTEQNTFINGGYHHTRYKTGSGFDLDSGLAQAGAWKKFTNDWALGIYAKYAGGSYKTFPIKVTGDANVFGGGLMTSYRYSDTGRLEATVEAGYVDAKFESSELLSTFKSKGMYYGASAGFVENPLEDLSLYANFNWKRKASDNITDDLDQKIKFDTLQSMALRFGGDYAFNSVDWKGVIPSVGASAIYEMDGKSTVTVEDVKNSEASMKGMSGRGQVSLAYHNQDTFLPLHSVLTVYGQVGKREGFGGEVNISFEF